MPDLSLTSLVSQVRETGHEAIMAIRLLRDLPPFLRTQLTFEEARARVQQRLARREQRFLDLVQKTIYEYPRSPYLRLLRHAGCEPGDFKALVPREGIEGTLTILARQGVYLTFDELKGRRVTVRGSARFTFAPQDLDHPTMVPHWMAYTGGTGGPPGAVKRSLPFCRDTIDAIATMLSAHGLRQARHVCWVARHVSPLFGYTILGQEIVRWFYPGRRLSLKARGAAGLLTLAGRLARRRIPSPRHLDVQHAARLAAWIDRRPRDGRPLLVSTLTSMAVRVAVAAHESGIDLTGVTFRLQSEPLTEARYRHLQASGADVIDNYGFMEATDLGYSCAEPGRATDLHLFSDRYALVQRERPVVDGGPTVNALLVTTISEVAPLICLNVEPGDYAHIEQRTCACELGALGLTTHLSDVRSFEKLSAKGVTFVRTRLISILEDVLPAHFGGTAIDYQLAEEEAPDSATRLVLRVSPTVGSVDEAALCAVLLAELASGGIMDQRHAELLRRADSVVVSRQPPLATAGGKVLPFHLSRAPTSR
jgi:hypothetical protein